MPGNTVFGFESLPSRSDSVLSGENISAKSSRPPATPVTKSDTPNSNVADHAFHQWRPLLHIMPPRGWLNDPCALGYDPGNDCYHVGFQWNPESAEWGNISWGSAVSRDLLSWDVGSRPSIVPTEDQDQKGVFTGCLSPRFPRPGELAAFYTPAKRLPIHHTLPYHVGSEALHLATSADGGRNWSLFAGNPILPGPPAGLNVTGWRDPYVSTWPSMAKTLNDPETTLYGIISGGLVDQGPTSFLYRLDPQDATKWMFLGPLTSLPRNFSSSATWSTDTGLNWEVTNFDTIPNPDGSEVHDFLIMGVEGRLPQPSNKGQTQFRIDHAQMWMAGRPQMEGGRPILNYQYGGFLDHSSFYAGNSFWDPKAGQHVIFGWVLEEDLPAELRKRQGWSGLMSFPRILKLQKLRGVTKALVSPLEEISSIAIRRENLKEGAAKSTFEVTTLCAIPDPRLRGLRKRMHSLTPGDTPGLPRRLNFPQGCASWELETEIHVPSWVKSVGVKLHFLGGKSSAI